MSRRLAVMALFIFVVSSWSRAFGQVELLEREGENVATRAMQESARQTVPVTDGQLFSQIVAYYVFTVTDDTDILEIAKNRRNWNTVALSTSSKSGKKVTHKYNSSNATNQIYHTVRLDMDATGATHLIVVKISSDSQIADILERGWLPKEENMHEAPIVPGHITYKNRKAVKAGTKVVLNDAPDAIYNPNPDLKVAGFCLLSHGQPTCALLEEQNFSAESVATSASTTNDLYDQTDGDGFEAIPAILDRFVEGAIITFCGCNTGVEEEVGTKSLAHGIAQIFKEKNVKVRGRIESGAVHNHYSHGMTYQYLDNEDGESYKLEKGYGLSPLTSGKFGDKIIVVDGQTLKRAN